MAMSVMAGGGPMRERPEYCTQRSVPSCRECSLSSYGKDCYNVPIKKDEGEGEA